MKKIDIAEVLQAKAPKLARRLPKFVINWLRRTIHEKEVNHIYQNYWDYAPQPFIRACFQTWDVSYSIEGLDKLDRNERYLFVSNHPFGGMDGMMLADKLIEHFGDVRVVVNDILRYIAPLDPLWVPVNKHGAQKLSYARKFDEAFFGDLPILTFPAGLCSRKIDGRVQDTPWRPNFLKKANASHRKIVPIFVEGRLSNFFYNLSNLRKRLGVKANIEMLWLVDEMLSQKGQHFRIIVGEPIDPASLHEVGTLAEQVEVVREKCYALQNHLAKVSK
ncbi:MAG: acyltransferase [Alistipes sp.]|nr:acyltransferase [Alistipes sp.]